MNSIYDYIILVFLMLWLCSCQEGTKSTTTILSVKNDPNLVVVAKDSLKLIPAEGIVYYQNKPFTGISLGRYPSGQEAVSLQYSNGIRDGKYIKWFADGTISYISEYKNGKQEGTAKSWWNNGNLRSQSRYISGIGQGQQTQWYKSGVKFKVMNLTDGKEEGIQTSWRENGKIYNNYEARNGRIFGLKRAALCFQLEDENVVYGKD